MDKILINIKVLYIHLKLLIRPTENNNFPLSNSVSSIEQCIISKRANIEKQVIANKKTLISSFHLSSSNNHGLQLQLLDRSIPISYFITRVTYPRNIPMQGINKGSNSKNWGGSRGDNTHTHTHDLVSSSVKPQRRRNGGGPVRIGQVHTCIIYSWAQSLWENSAAVQTRLGRARTVSRLQGYPVSRANEPRELPYVVAYPRRKDRPRITGSQWPTIFFPTGFQPFFRARRENGSIGSSPPRFPEIWRITNALILWIFFLKSKISCFSSIWRIIYALV